MKSRRCAACKHLRRRCPSDCIFSPYFPSNDPRRFAYVHKIFGASNVGKLLEDVPVNRRGEAAETLFYEAYCRIKDPVYGCAGMVSLLDQQLKLAESQLATVKAEVAALKNNLHQKPFEFDALLQPTLDPCYLSHHTSTATAAAAAAAAAPLSYNTTLATCFD